MTTPPTDYTGQLLTYLQAWRQYLEQAAAGTVPVAAAPPPATYPQAPPMPSLQAMPPWPWVPPMPPGLPFPPLPVPPPGLMTAAPTTSWPTPPLGGAAGVSSAAPPGPPIPPVASNAPETGAPAAGTAWPQVPPPGPLASRPDTTTPSPDGFYGTYGIDDSGAGVGADPPARKARLVGSAFPWAVETGPPGLDDLPPAPAQAAAPTAPPGPELPATRTVVHLPPAVPDTGPPIRHEGQTTHLPPRTDIAASEQIPPRFGESFAFLRRSPVGLGGQGWWAQMPLPGLPTSVGAGGLPPWRFPGVQGLPTTNAIPPLVRAPTIDPRIIDPRIGVNAARRSAPPTIEIKGGDPQA